MVYQPPEQVHTNQTLTFREQVHINQTLTNLEQSLKIQTLTASGFGPAVITTQPAPFKPITTPYQ